jgi:hypothetical protein
MKVLKYIFPIFIVFSSVLFSQPIKSDFKINQDNQPSTIHQTDPKVFVKDANRFLLTWTDYRRGDEKIYAQWYDGNGNKIGGNFEIAGNYDVVFVNDSTFVAVYYRIENNISYYTVNFYGKIYANNNPSGNDVFLGIGHIPDCCWTGYSGYFSTFLAHKNSLLAFISDNGQLKKTTVTIPTSEGLMETIPTDGKAIHIRSQKLITDNYALFWFRDTMWFNVEGLYGNFYNQNGRLLTTKKVLDYKPQLSYNDFPLIVTNLPDTLYCLLYLDVPTSTLNVVKLNGIGDQVDSSKIQLPIFLTSYSSISNVYLSNLNNDKFYFLFYVSSGNKVYKYMYEFNQSGNFTGNYWVDTVLQANVTFGKTFFNEGNQNFLTGLSQNGDVFKVKLNLFNPISIEKANDDVVGSNENIAFMSQKDNNTYFVYYSDEVGWRGRFISADGNILSEEKNLGSNNIRFFNDGSAIGLWFSKFNDFDGYAGFIYYDENLNKLKIDTLKSGGNNVVVFAGYITYQILDNSNVLILYRAQNYNYARLQTKNGNVIKEISLGPGIHFFPKIFKHSDSVYILNYSGKIQLFNTNLDTLSTAYDGDIKVYLGNYRYISHFQYQAGYPGPIVEYVVLKTITGDSLKTIQFTSYPYFNVSPINEKYFMVSYHNYYNFIASTYTASGLLARGPIQINQSVSASRKNLTAYHFNDRVYFLWADTRDGNYDIYCSIFNRGTLTSIEENPISEIDFRLEQNYPNPFNAMTRIKYSIKDEGRVTLKIYDLLGRETALLVDEIKSPGTYEVEFNANNLSSGVYVYQLKQGDKTLSRKLVLLK